VRRRGIGKTEVEEGTTTSPTADAGRASVCGSFARCWVSDLGLRGLPCVVDWVRKFRRSFGLLVGALSSSLSTTHSSPNSHSGCFGKVPFYSRLLVQDKEKIQMKKIIACIKVELHLPLGTWLQEVEEKSQVG